MPHLRSISRLGFIVGAALLFVAVSPATAQESEGAGAQEGQSLLTIILDAAGWIGLVIFVMSLASATIIIQHFWTIRRSTMAPEAEIDANRELIEQREFKACVERVGKGDTMFHDVLSIGLRHGRHGFTAMQEAAEERAGAWRSRMFRRVEYLNIIGNISPLMGLLGTVLGMIKAFAKMNALHGAYGPDDLAGGISLALVSTFLGLIVAIVSLAFFGVCRNRVDSLTIAAHAAVVDLLEYFRPGTTPINGGEPLQPPAEPVKAS